MTEDVLLASPDLASSPLTPLKPPSRPRPSAASRLAHQIRERVARGDTSADPAWAKLSDTVVREAYDLLFEPVKLMQHHFGKRWQS